MTEPAGTRAAATTRWARWALPAVALTALLVMSCSTAASGGQLVNDLRGAGFSDVDATVNATRNPFVLVVSADAPAGDSTAEGHAEAAEIVWTTYPRRFERLRISIDGGKREYTRAQLAQRFGARPEGLEKGDIEGDVTRDIGLLIAMLGLGVFSVLGAIFAALLVSRSRRQLASRPRPGTMVHPAPWVPPRPSEPSEPTGASGSSGSSEPTPPPPGSIAPTHVTPTPPPGGWVPAGSPVAPWDPATAVVGAEPVVEERAWPVLESGAERRADRRRYGRRPRGPMPPATHLPPGWDN